MVLFWLMLVFVLGAAVGSFLNLCIDRLPYEKSLFWPGRRCEGCWQPLPWYRHVPLIGSLIPSGRCRSCGVSLSLRPLVVELFTALGFVGLFSLDILVNVHNLNLLNQHREALRQGQIPWQGWIVFGHHALLLCFLLAASFIDLAHFEIPLSITATGTIVGLVSALLWPWPWPETIVALPHGFQKGLYPWPLWHPLPGWLQPGGNWQTGLATGLAGVLAGMALLRSIRFVFGLGRGKEGLGVGDADLMMMAGSFLGWQPVVIAFFVSVFPALLIGLTQLAIRGDQELAFGPSLSLGILLTMLGWRWIGPQVEPLFFDGWVLLFLIVAGGVFLLIASFLLRLIRGPGPGQQFSG
jgi:leader peptidase (prepilin peptidase)/N-methyltransferase